MKLKTAAIVQIVIAIVTVLIMLILRRFFNGLGFAVGFIIVIAANHIFNLIFLRCPHCDRWLGGGKRYRLLDKRYRLLGGHVLGETKYCPYCGKKFN